MAILERLQGDLKDAMRAKDVVARDTLRMVLAAMKNRRIELGRDLEEGEELAVLAKSVKSRHDSAEQYAELSRSDLAERELAEIEVIQRYLPRQLSEDDVRELVKRTIETVGASSKKEMGQVMKAVMAEHKGRVDGKLVQRLAGELLG